MFRGLIHLVLLVGMAHGETPDLDFFKAQVLPILEKRCFECHSHTSGKMKGNLALDSRSGWITGGDRGPALVPGHPEKSLIVTAIRHSDPDLKMPKEKLPPSEIEVLERWIAAGAHDPRVLSRIDATPTEWWSLKPLKLVREQNAGIPSGTHPIDFFVDRKLSEQGRKRSPRAEPASLLRRLHFNLHGLPPSIEEVEAYTSRDSELEWQKEIDRLLASPHYGERWARHWLDTVHFADTHGFEHDVLRLHAWRYRDYVISSLNRDTPWTRFVREQLAADAFFPDSPELTPALGFLGAGPYDQSAAGTAPKNFENLDRDDLVMQTMTAFTSTTVHCARCHAHKFDPIPQEDYYALQSVFAGVGKGDITFDETLEVSKRRKQWNELKAAAEKRREEVLLAESFRPLIQEWEAGRASMPAWRPVRLETFVSSEGATLECSPDGIVWSKGKRPDKDTILASLSPGNAPITAIRLEAIADPSLPQGGPGRNDNGNFHLSEFELQWFAPGAKSPEKARFVRATADFDQEGWDVSKAIDRNAATAWAIHPSTGKTHTAVFELDPKQQPPADARWVFLLKQLHGTGHVLGAFRISVIEAAPGVAIALNASAESALRAERKSRTKEQSLALAAPILKLRAELELGLLPPVSKVYAAGASAENERGTITFKEPRTIRILARGDVEKPGAEAAPGALGSIANPPPRFHGFSAQGESARRAWLADWIVHPNNPLAWRSIVNRIWHYHFGRGLCDTPGDLGRMGGTPTHPELIDWLAAWFRDEAGGSIKALHRLILTSHTYQQSSANSDPAFDPENRMLSRMNRIRLDADSYRDAVMSASGTLDSSMGGPGVGHFKSSPGPQVTPVLDYGVYDWTSAGATRRSIYRVVWRAIPDPFMEALDFPDMSLLASTRTFSVSAPQALVLWNNEFVLSHARELARRAESTSVDERGQLQWAMRRICLRNPATQEAETLLDLKRKHGLAAVCRVLLNSNEFLFVD